MQFTLVVGEEVSVEPFSGGMLEDNNGDKVGSEERVLFRFMDSRRTMTLLSCMVNAQATGPNRQNYTASSAEQVAKHNCTQVKALKGFLFSLSTRANASPWCIATVVLSLSIPPLQGATPLPLPITKPALPQNLQWMIHCGGTCPRQCSATPYQELDLSHMVFQMNWFKIHENDGIVIQEGDRGLCISEVGIYPVGIYPIDYDLMDSFDATKTEIITLGESLAMYIFQHWNSGWQF